MTPQEALNLLDQVASQLSANREVHQKIEQAVRVLNRILVGQITKPEGDNNGQ